MKCHEINAPEGMDENTLHAILRDELGATQRIGDRHFLQRARDLGRSMPVIETEKAEAGYQSIAVTPGFFRGHIDPSRLTPQRRGELEAMGFSLVPSDTPVQQCLSRAQTFSGAYTAWTSAWPLIIMMQGSEALGYSDARELDFTALSSPTVDQTVTGSGVTICLVDNGYDESHAAGETASITYTSVHDEHGTAFEGHGNVMIGCIAAASYGLAPGVDVESYRWSNSSGGGTTTNVNNCLAALITQDTGDDTTKRICNMSFQASSATNPFLSNMTTIQARGIPIIAAAGNNSFGGNVGAPLDQVTHIWPAEAGLNAAGTSGLCVTATAFNHQFAFEGFCNYGPLTNVMVPAVYARTLALSGATQVNYGVTSMAAAYCSAAHALLYEGTARLTSAAEVLAFHRTLLDGCLHVNIDGTKLAGAHHTTAQYTYNGVTNTALLYVGGFA